MNYLDLFSGIGGFALGAYWAGWKFENHYFSEVDKYCVRLYQKRFPDSVSLGDIKNVDADALPGGNWIITGGFPCQDISVAGKGAGLEGERSSLWFEMWRVIRGLRPEFAIIENVGAITFRGLSAVLSTLAEIGYDAEWQDIRASDMGAPHRRERIWIVAYPGLQRQAKYEEQTTGLEQCGEDVADSKRIGRRRWNNENDSGQSGALQIEGSCTTDQSTVLADSEKQPKRESTNQINTESDGRETWQEFSSRGWWAVEPGVGRVASRIPRRVDRLKGLGNSIVPQIAELLFRQIRNIERKDEKWTEKKLLII